jgi:hypothetical protein
VDDLYEARRLLERSIALDPKYARAYAALSLLGCGPLDEDFLIPAALERAHRLARFVTVYTMKPEDLTAFRRRPKSEQEAIDKVGLKLGCAS